MFTPAILANLKRNGWDLEFRPRHVDVVMYRTSSGNQVWRFPLDLSEVHWIDASGYEVPYNRQETLELLATWEGVYNRRGNPDYEREERLLLLAEQQANDERRFAHLSYDQVPWSEEFHQQLLDEDRWMEENRIEPFTCD